jgi:clan AA aspartic protease (TIGR02281 family)
LNQQKFFSTLTLLLAVSILFGCNVHSVAPDKEGSKTHLNAAKDHLQNEEFEQALSEAREAVALDPNSAQAHAVLADAMAESNKSNQAIGELESALKLSPNDPKILNQYVTQLEDLERYDDAIASEKKLVSLSPKDAALHRQASWLYTQVGDTQGALAMSREAVKINPKEEKNWTDLANVLNDMSKADEALQVCKKGLSVIPDSNELNYTMGLILSGSKNPKAAIMPLKRALELDPDDDAARELMEKLSQAAGKPIYMVKLNKLGNSNIVEVVVNEKVRTKLVLDTGATSVVISNAIAKQCVPDLSTAETVDFTSVTGSGSGRAVKLSSLRVGTAKVSNVEAIVHDMPSNSTDEGLLGMTFLKHFRVTLDSENSQLWLTTR